MAKSTLFEGAAGGPIKDTDVMAYKEEGIVVGDPKRIHFFSAMKTYFQGLLPGKVSDIESSMGSIEYPTIGDPIDPDIDELFLEGINTGGVTSKGREPHTHSEDFVSTTLKQGNEETINPIVKFPNRGSHGFFEDYTNAVYGVAETHYRGITEEYGEWTKLRHTDAGNGGIADVSYYVTGTGINSLAYVVLKRPDNQSANSDVYIQNSADDDFARININWTNTTFTATKAINYSYFVSDSIAVVQFASDGTISDFDRIKIVCNDTNLYGEYGFYKDVMVVDGLAIPLPYIAESHDATCIKYTVEWPEYQNWTFEHWAYTEPGAGNYRATFNTAAGFRSDHFYLYYDGNEPGWFLTSKVSYAGDPVAITGAVDSVWNHFKIQFVSATSITITTNGGTPQVITTDIPAVEDMDDRDFMIGFSEGSFYFNGYISDFVVRPYIDSSTDHYTSGLPYYNPDSTYGKNGSFSISKDGTVKTNNLMSNGRRVPTISSGESFPTYNVGLGDECYRTDLDEFYKFNGTVWLQI